MAFAYSTYLCTSTKLYILLIILTLGILGYLVAEILFHRRKKYAPLATGPEDTDEQGIPLMEREGEEEQQGEGEEDSLKQEPRENGLQKEQPESNSDSDGTGEKHKHKGGDWSSMDEEWSSL